jgi:uncharacterized protein (DUF169 family)
MEEDLKRNEELAKEYQDLLWPEGYLVAVKLVKNSEIESLGRVRRPGNHVTFCQCLAQAQYIGRKLLVGAEDQGCYAFGHFFGMKEAPEKFWKRYVGWQLKTEEAAQKVFESIPKFPLGSYDAAFISPLGKCPVAPDAVVLFGNASQMLAILTGYLFDKGGTFTMESNNMVTCGGVIVAPILQKRPKVIIPGNAARLLAIPSADLACGIPGDYLEELAGNMRFMKNHGGSQYPPAWQHIQWEPESPIGDLLKPDGTATWIKDR